MRGDPGHGSLLENSPSILIAATEKASQAFARAFECVAQRITKGVAGTIECVTKRLPDVAEALFAENFVALNRFAVMACSSFRAIAVET